MRTRDTTLNYAFIFNNSCKTKKMLQIAFATKQISKERNVYSVVHSSSGSQIKTLPAAGIFQ